MKSMILSPQSMKSNNPTTTMDENQSCYFPGCRKDANCTCDICLDSINATLDLMPMSVQKNSLTKLSVSKPAIEKTPVSIDPTLLSTPSSRTPLPCKAIPVKTPTPLRSTARTGCNLNGVAKKRKLCIGLKYLRWVLWLGFIFGLELGFSWGIVRVLMPRLSGEIVRDLAAKGCAVKSLNERLVLIQKGLSGYVDGHVSSCNLGDSTWKIDQDSLILSSHCILYRWAAEQVIVWGWPLQTTGLLAAGFSSRSLTIVSGRVTEWPEGKIVSVVRETNSTWIQRKWSTSVVQFDPNTWIIEYKRRTFVENPSLFYPAVEFFKFKFSRFTRRIKQQFWHLLDQRSYWTSGSSKAGLNVPT